MAPFLSFSCNDDDTGFHLKCATTTKTPCMVIVKLGDTASKTHLYKQYHNKALCLLPFAPTNNTTSDFTFCLLSFAPTNNTTTSDFTFRLLLFALANNTTSDFTLCLLSFAPNPPPPSLPVHVCACTCMHVSLCAHAHRCGVQGIQYYVNILFFCGFMSVFVDLGKRDVLTLVGEMQRYRNDHSHYILII